MRIFAPFISVFFLLFFLSTETTSAQVNPKDSLVPVSLVELSYTHQFPFADLEERFHSNSAIGLGFRYKFSSNWTLGIRGRFRTGSGVKQDDILSELTTGDDWLIGQDGLFAEYRLVQRGWSGEVTFGRVFPWFGPNPNSGVLVEGGVGLLTHKIHIDLRDEVVPALQGDYIKGYDRLSVGPAFSQSLGYLFLGNDRLVSFYIGVEFIQAITTNVRKWNFDEGRAETENRLDLLLGVNASWFLPIYPRKADSYDFFF